MRKGEKLDRLEERREREKGSERKLKGRKEGGKEYKEDKTREKGEK